VVTYDVVVAVDNQDLSLLPGMTAYATITIAQRRHVLLIPDAALRVHLARRAAPAGTGEQSVETVRGTGGAESATVYILGPSGPRPVRITLGITDNTNTQVLSGPLRQGERVITGLQGRAQQMPQRAGFFRIF